MWNRRYLHALALLALFGIVFFQARSQGYTAALLYRYRPKTTARLHLLVPASQAHVQLCRVLVSSALLGYPPVVLSGWNGTGELDASVTHLAKVRNIMRYLDGVTPYDDDDLVLILDGYDVILQLPPDLLVRRYFEVTQAANAELTARYGEADDANAPRLAVLFGPDKLCWPVDMRRPACWAVPESGLAEDAFGNATGHADDMTYNQPRWLNSGTIMGPAGALRRVFNATMERIRTTYDPAYEARESDQMYLSDVWGEQEYVRLLREHELETDMAGMTDMDGTIAADEPPYVPPGGPDDKWLPAVLPGQPTEFGIGLDYESVLFQPWAGYDRFLDLLTFDGPNASAMVTRNVNDEPGFVPYDIHLPADVWPALARLLAAAGQPRDLVHGLALGTNLVTRHVYSLFHCTGEKGFLDELWPRMWFYPYAQQLLNATVLAVQAGAPLSPDRIDGRTWHVAKPYPALPDVAADGRAVFGAWADLDNRLLRWPDLCAGHEDVLFPA